MRFIFLINYALISNYLPGFIYVYLTARLYKFIFKLFTFCCFYYIKKTGLIEADINI